MTSHPTFSIVTPSYKQLPWLKLCVASVADQEGVEAEHLIQDAGSGPDLTEWVHNHSQAKLWVENDTGMYDAINRGFHRTSGDILAWLNCDEQYLPGALAKVADFFQKHPETEVLFGDAILINSQGKLLSYRRAILPSLIHLQLSHRDVLSCATFIRRSVIERRPTLDSRWKSIADGVWLEDLIKAKVRMAVIPEPLAAFALTSENLSQTNLALEESNRRQKAVVPPWMRMLRGPVILFHRLRKLFHGAYMARNFSTRLYTLSSPLARLPVRTQRLSFRWPHLVS